MKNQEQRIKRLERMVLKLIDKNRDLCRCGQCYRRAQSLDDIEMINDTDMCIECYAERSELNESANQKKA
jgi:hypothetical protein